MALNFDSLDVVVTDLPEITGRGGGRPTKDNPFTNMVSESFADGRGRGITVERKDVAEAVSLIRRAAASIQLGVRVVLTDARNNVVKIDDIETLGEKQKVKVLFQGKEKRKMTRKKKTDQDNAVASENTVELPGDVPTA